jgi:glutathione S-transferase
LAPASLTSYRRHAEGAIGQAMITIYGDAISGNCLKVKWTAERVGAAFRWIDVDVTKRETRTPQFLAMNPAGQVPTVVLADGRPLAQSNAIILHLAEGSALIPADPYDRAKTLEWLFWEQYSHEPYVAVVRFRMKYQGKTRAELDPALIAGAEAALNRLEQTLTGRRYLVGDALSLADIALVAYTRFAADGGFQLSDYPALDAWVARLEAELPIKEPR